jgi:hypothetical protein
VDLAGLSAALSPSAGSTTVFATLVGGFIALIAIFPNERRQSKVGWTLGLTSLLGIGFCVGYMIWGPHIWLAGAVACFTGAAVVTITSIWLHPYLLSLAGSAGWLSKLLPRPWTALRFTVGLTLLVTAGVVVGILLGGTSSPPSVTAGPSSPYRIGGTCANGACTVNECEKPESCGLEFKGRLREGVGVDIVCQLSGGVVKAPDGHHHSDIWDRLASGLYISDLFVEGTETNRFTPRLPTCAELEE